MKTKNYRWGPGQRKTVQYIFQWSIKREPRPVTSDSVKYLWYERRVWADGRKPNRIAVGCIRAMGAQHFFKGCYVGAENE